MPLSDHEQRLLEQMERALYAEDPKFADSLRKTRRASMDRKRMALGLFGALAGLAVLLVGVATSLPIIGLFGFLATVAGAFVAYQAFSAKAAEGEVAAGETAGGSGTKGQSAAAPPKRGAADSGNGLMDRLEERWRRRREQDGGGQY